MRMNETRRAGCRAIMVAAMAAIAGCAALQEPLGGDVVRYEYQRPDGRAFVRIERIEPEAPLNAHPATLRADQVRMALAAVREKNAQTFGSDDPLLDPSELDEIAPPLAKALAAATPAQDVTFLAIGAHGLFGGFSPPTATTGRVFLRDGKLNIIIGLARSPYEAIDISGTRKQVAPGQRKARVEYGWTLTAPGGQLVDQRGDWLAFDVASLIAPAAPSTPVAAPMRKPDAPAGVVPANPVAPAAAIPAADDARYQDVAAKLRILDRLHANGLVSDDEYRERRRAILQGM